MSSAIVSIVTFASTIATVAKSVSTRDLELKLAPNT